MTCLLDLPVTIDIDEAAETSIIIDSYLAELNAVQNHEQLKDFMIRWRNLWALEDPEDRIQSKTERTILEFDFDFFQVFKLLQFKNDSNAGFDFENDTNARIMANIAAPYPLILAGLFSKKYQVGHDLGMVRLYLDNITDKIEEAVINKIAQEVL